VVTSGCTITFSASSAVSTLRGSLRPRLGSSSSLAGFHGIRRVFESHLKYALTADSRAAGAQRGVEASQLVQDRPPLRA